MLMYTRLAKRLAKLGKTTIFTMDITNFKTYAYLFL